MPTSPARGRDLAVTLGLSRPVAARLASLRTPERIQDYVGTLGWNHEVEGPTARSVVETLGAGVAHCVEAALVAGLCLWLSGEPPLLMDLGAARGDVDHVVAVFRRRGYWGCISKSNSPFLRYREPMHRSLRELAISYFPFYMRDRRKTLRSYSAPIDLRQHDPALWVTRAGFCHELIDTLTAARHYALLPAGADRELRRLDPVEARANLVKEYPRG